jgi:hypothetical protein
VRDAEVALDRDVVNGVVVYGTGFDTTYGGSLK